MALGLCLWLWKKWSYSFPERDVVHYRFALRFWLWRRWSRLINFLFQFLLFHFLPYFEFFIGFLGFILAGSQNVFEDPILKGSTDSDHLFTRLFNQSMGLSFCRLFLYWVFRNDVVTMLDLFNDKWFMCFIKEFIGTRDLSNDVFRIMLLVLLFFFGYYPLVVLNFRHFELVFNLILIVFNHSFRLSGVRLEVVTAGA